MLRFFYSRVQKKADTAENRYASMAWVRQQENRIHINFCTTSLPNAIERHKFHRPVTLIHSETNMFARDCLRAAPNGIIRVFCTAANKFSKWTHSASWLSIFIAFEDTLRDKSATTGVEIRNRPWMESPLGTVFTHITLYGAMNAVTIQ